ncbi:MAG: hypothetical protein AAFM91_08630 [Pseudomonadota bacterium]
MTAIGRLREKVERLLFFQLLTLCSRTASRTTIRTLSAILTVCFLASCSTNPWVESNFRAQREDARDNDDFLPWSEAAELIVDRCQEVTGIFQGHSRVVSIGFQNEETVTTISPKIDQVIGIVERCHSDFESVAIIME